MGLLVFLLFCCQVLFPELKGYLTYDYQHAKQDDPYEHTKEAVDGIQLHSTASDKVELLYLPR